MWKAITIAVLATLSPPGVTASVPPRPIERKPVERAKSTFGVPTATDLPALKVSF